DLLRQFFGDFSSCALRLEEFRIDKDRAKKREHPGLIDLCVGKLLCLLNGAVEVRADDVAVEIADDEKRWIEKRLAVTEKLAIGFIEVLLLAFVFPGETTALPDIGKATFLVGLFRDASTIIEGEELGVL